MPSQKPGRTRYQRSTSPCDPGKGGVAFAVSPLARAVALVLAVSAGQAEAGPRASGPDWFAAARSGAAERGSSAARHGAPLAQQQRSREHLQRSITNLSRTAAAVAAQRAAQDTARKAAREMASNIPNGLTEGGLKVDTHPDTAGWLNAEDPTQSVRDGHTTVNIKQTANKAILNWETFNVSRDTTVDFDQQANWAALNRVNDPNARPSQIQGQIKGDGTVMLVNRNGVVFSGSSQVNVRNLVAAAADISDEQFREHGIYGEGNQAVFTNAQGNIDVQAGARLATSAPKTSTQGGGYTLLMGRNVSNAGEIITEQGQTTLAAGEDFYIRKGRGTEENLASTTDGNEVASRQSAASALDGSAGTVTNSGLILSPEGDITLTGHDVRQEGVAVATTSVDARGTVHLLNSASDASGKVTLGEGSVTAVVIDEDGGTALDSRRQTLINQSAKYDLEREGLNDGVFDNLAELPDRRDQSRVEIVSGGNVIFEDDSLTQATGGQIAVAAGNRVRVESGSELDVSGAVGVRVAMESNNVLINVQSNEQRDSPVNRDSGALKNGDVWIDRRELIHVPAGTGGYETDRWYTAGGLLEVGGYLDTIPHSAGEWAAAGGTVRLHGDAVISQSGSAVNLSGGTLNVQTGYIRQTWLKGADGKLYDAATAPGYLRYTGLYRGYERNSERWGQTQAWRNPLINPEKRLENGYVTGRDAGQLIVSAPTAILEGDLVAEVYNGDRQTRARAQGLDGYSQAQNSVARAGQLLLGKYGLLGLSGGFDSDVRIGDIEDVATELERGAELGERLGTVWLDAARLNEQGLGGLDLVSAGGIAVERDVNVAPGGYVRLASGQVDVDATVTARSGEITLTNIIEAYTDGNTPVRTALTGADGETYLRLGAEGVLDARGLWSNQVQTPDSAGLAHRDGGRVTLSSSRDVTLEAGSLIDVSSGGAVTADGRLLGGRGGDITLSAATTVNENSSTPQNGVLTLNGDLRGYGVDGGGTLTLQTGESVVVGDRVFESEGLLAAGDEAPVDLTLLEEVVIAAGETLPFDYEYTRTSAAPGQPLGDSPITITSAAPLTLAADWTIPESATGMFRIIVGGQNVFGSGSTVPAGSVITAVVEPSVGTLPADYIVPADAFPNGIPVQASQSVLPAGTPLPDDVVFAAGATLAAGSVLSHDVRVAPVLQLGPEQFRNGFSQYDINGHGGVLVTDGAEVDVAMPVYRFRPGRVAATTAEQALELWTPPLYQSQAGANGAVRRAGAGLTLRSESQGRPGSVTVGKGATVQVDPGQPILLSGGQTTVEGTLRAQGGRIDILNPESDAQQQALSPARSIWIGENAVLDASGYAYSATDARGRRYGEVLDGGQVTLGSHLPEERAGGLYEINNQFIIVRDGAVIDVSGARTDLDLGGESLTTVAGDAGGLAMRSNAGIYFDGELRAESGGKGAAGGSLDVMLETIVLPVNVGDERQTELRTIVVGEGIESGLSGELVAGKDDATLRFGQARFASDDIDAWGVDSLSLWAHDAILFEGDTRLDLGRKIELSAAVIGAAPETPNIEVDLAAPYIRLAGRSELPEIPGSTSQQGTGPFFDFGNSQISPDSTHEDSRFSVRADLIDLGQGAVTFGGHGTRGLLGGNQAEVDLPGFGQVTLDSRGDIRLDNAILTAQHELRVIAERLYPVTHSVNALRVGDINPDIENGGDAVLSIRRRGEGAPELPPSVFGSVYLLAPNIEQNGAITAPLGLISVGRSGVNLAFGSGADPAYDARDIQVDAVLGSDSITSISAKGLVLPYGYTTDGIDYFYNGEKVLFDQALSGDGDEQGQRTGGGIAFNTATFLAEEGAVVDISAGGVLQGVGFRSGQQGSVNILDTALANAAPWYSGSGDNRVYAILPGMRADAAPIDPALTGPDRVGEQITIGAGVPGLPAGTYTLLPAEYAMMPGGFRVELGATERFDNGIRNGAAPGLHHASVYVGLANTGLVARQPRQALIMSGQQVRRYGDFDETTLTQWVVGRQAEFGAARTATLIPEDMRTLSFDFGNADVADERAFRFEGELRNDRVEGGAGGMVAFSGQPLEVVGDAGQGADDRITLLDDDLNGLGATILGLGVSPLNSGGSMDSWRVSTVVRSGASLRAGTVILGGQVAGDDVVVESGATIDTRGFEAAGWTAANGIVVKPDEDQALLVVSNDLMTFTGARGDGQIRIEDGAGLFGEGTLALLAPGGSEIGEVAVGARDLLLGVEDVNVGTDGALDQAAAEGVLSNGWRLTQQVLDGLLRPAEGPGIESLSFQASNSINFFGPVSLDTFDSATGESSADLRFITPAIYGLGGEGDTATLRTDRFTWSGLGYIEGVDPVAAEPGPVIDGGAGTGTGGFRVDANEVVFGFNGPVVDKTANLSLDRLMLGFQDVEFNATQRITSEREGAVSVYQRDLGDGQYRGGNLTLNAPVLTGQARSDITFRSGGNLTVARPEGAEPVDRSSLDLGGRLSLDGNRVRIDGTVAAPSGRIDIHADEDVELTEGSVLDVAGREVTFFDVTRHSFGGDLVLESRQGDVHQAAGATLDVSARGSDAGTVKATAANGQVALEGDLIARAADQPDNGFEGGSIQVEGLTILDFVGLNQRLGSGGFDYRRDFTLGSGDLVIGDELQARHLSVTADGGSLTVAGTVRAGGDYAGSLRLAARDDLTIESDAVLDASGDTLKRDSDGGAIEGSNRATLDLTTRDGRLVLADGATLDVSAGGENRGTIDLNARRLGDPSETSATGNDVAVDAGTGLTVNGAKRVSVNGFWTYDDAPVDPDADADSEGPDTQLVDQAYLDEIDKDSIAFINAALANDALQQRLAGLKDAAGDIFSLRPGVEIVSATEDGNLRIDGDLNFAGYRYGPDVDADVYGSGTAGVFVMRAGGDLEVNGNVTDGFHQPPATPDDSYRVDFELSEDLFDQSDELIEGYTLSQALKLKEGWELGGAESLPFDLIWEQAFEVDSRTTLPVDVTLADDVRVTRTTLAGEVHLPDGVTVDDRGTLYTGTIPAGTELTSATLPAGSVVSAGNEFTRPLLVEPMAVGAGTALDGFEVASSKQAIEGVELSAGVVLPAGLGLAWQDGLAGDDIDQKIWTVASLLPEGTESWDLNLVAGANLSSASHRTTNGAGTGDLILDNAYLTGVKVRSQAEAPEGISVIRTGSGDLELIAGRDYLQNSRFGVYTAGGAADGTGAPAYQRDSGTLPSGGYEPDPEDGPTYLGVAEATPGAVATGGGNVTVSVGRDMKGDESDKAGLHEWLWTWSDDATGEQAWWLNTGSYGAASGVTGFDGLGTLGGGNLSVSVGRDFGFYEVLIRDGSTVRRGRLNLAVGASGWVDARGERHQYGGGELRLDVAGAVNNPHKGNSSLGEGDGEVTNVRGGISAQAGSIGQLWHTYNVEENNDDPRNDNELLLADKDLYGGLRLVVGDAVARLDSYGDALIDIVNPSTDGVELWVSTTDVAVISSGGNVGLGRTEANALGGSAIPARFSAAALEGSIYGNTNDSSTMARSWFSETATDGWLDILAGDSIYTLGLSSAYEAALLGTEVAPARFYARDGDIYQLVYGEYGTFRDQFYNQAGRSAHIRAGRDIVEMGATRAAVGHYGSRDISLIKAGRDLIYINTQVVGPGTLELTAGRNFYQADRGWVRSVGPFSEGASDANSSGADIAVNVGMGASGPDYQALIDAYLNPANLADPDLPLGDQPDRVARTYEEELATWLIARYGEEAVEGTDALAYFQALAPEQQRVFLRDVYYTELREGGREFNDPDGDRYGSYLRSRRMIETLLPQMDSEAGTSGYRGDYTMFTSVNQYGNESSGLLRTEGGGDIQMLVPGGDLVIGLEGVTPEGGDNGILTQGSGDIQLFSQGDIALGLSRIFTTYGGDIFAWSNAGDINAGRGAKTTLVYTPPRRVYDTVGNVTLSPSAPTTGAGIATLAPIPEVPPGDVDLIAPLGVIDAGEAGIRVSGNVNVAALQVVNAENIDVQGDSTGLPAVATVNVGALTSASNAASSAVQAAEQVGRRYRQQPSVIRVEILGYGEQSLESEEARPASSPPPLTYNQDSNIQVIGDGALNSKQSNRLTPKERRTLAL